MSVVRSLWVVVCASLALACSPSTPDFDASALVGPYLSALDVTSATSSDVTLVPAFVPDVYDYYVTCFAGPNPLTVTMTASAGASSALVAPTPTAPKPKQTVSVEVRENQAIVATATSGKATTEYWIRCLPHDFPPLMMVTHPENGAPPRGYYLIGDSRPAKGASGYAIMLDAHGVPVWYARGRNGAAVGDVDAVVAGAISFFSSAGLPAEVLNLDPPEMLSAAPAGTVLDPHELQVLPNGNYLVLSNPTTKGVDLTGLAIPLPDGGVQPLGPNSNMAECNIVEFEPTTGRVVWTWIGSDHFDPVRDSTFPQFSLDGLPGGGRIVDTYHCNSIDIEPGSSNLLISAREMDSVFYIERATGKVLWKMGGSPYTKDHATYVPVDDPFLRQHDARLLPGWSGCGGGRGQVTVFDDQTSASGVARAVVYDVVVGAPAGAPAGCGTGVAGPPRATASWQYGGQANSLSRGSFRILPDGSRVIGWGNNGVENFVFSEVDAQGNDLVDFYFTGGDVSYRAIKIPTSAFDLAILRKTAGTF